MTPVRYSLASAGVMVSALGGRLEATASPSIRAPWQCGRCKKKSPPVRWDGSDEELRAFFEFAQRHAKERCE